MICLCRFAGQHLPLGMIRIRVRASMSKQDRLVELPGLPSVEGNRTHRSSFQYIILGSEKQRRITQYYKAGPCDREYLFFKRQKKESMSIHKK